MGIHAGDKISAISINQRGKIETRKFYAWGGKNMIDTISMSAQVQGNVMKDAKGTHVRGGANNRQGIWLVDQKTDGSQPLELYLNYQNQAILYHKYAESLEKSQRSKSAKWKN